MSASLFQRLAANWVYGGFVSAFILVPLGLVFLRGESTALLLLFLHLPAYQIHQFEEHDRDRFRLYMNRVAGGGKEILTVPAVFWINIGFVWALFAALIVLAALAGVGWGLGVVYGTLANAVIHIAAALRNRAYNPGLATAVFLFLPLSATALWVVSRAPGVDWLEQAAGLLIGLGVHAAIMIHLARRARSLP